MLGWDDLKPQIAVSDSTVECPVRNCAQRVKRQSKTFRRQNEFLCPVHQIYISPSTFEHVDYRENLIWASEEDRRLLDAIASEKRESRMARERSEDAVTWNVFRFLERHKLLGKFIAIADGGRRPSAEPSVVYWSYCQRVCGAAVCLSTASKAFGEKPKRGSEPDVILETPEVLVFVEAKLGSGNKTTPSDPSRRDRYVIGGNGWHSSVFLPGSTFDVVAVEEEKYELLRLWLLGTWSAAQTGKRFVLVNLLRDGVVNEADIEQRFGRHIQSDDRRSFVRTTWEQVNDEIVAKQADSPDRNRMLRFFEKKTLGYAGRFHRLQKAFTV